MNKRIVALCSLSAVLSLGAGGIAYSATGGPVSSMNESTSPGATTQAAPSAAPAQSAPGAAAPGAAAPAAPQAAPAATPDAAPAAPGAAASAVQSSDVSDEQLRKFVASAQQVAVLSQQYSQQLQGVQDQSQQQQVVEEANGKMAEAIQSNGLTVQEFNGISEAVDSDPELNARARQMLQ